MRFGVLECHHEHIVEFINEMLQLGHKLIGICDSDSDMAQNVAQRYGVPLIKDTEQFFDLKPEIVGTSAINSEKIDVVEKCKTHGVHVMADKPIVTDMEGYKKLKSIIDESSIQIGLMLTERFNPPIYTLWKMIQEGHLGDLVSLSFLKPHKLRPDARPSWHFSKRQNGGIVIDLLIHDLDLLYWFTSDEIEECSGYVRKTAFPQYPDFYNSVHMLVKMRSGVLATLQADWWIPDNYWTWGDGRIFCVGTKGRAEVKTVGDWMNPRQPYGIWASDRSGVEFFDICMPPVTLAQDFLNRVAGRDDVIISAWDILKASYAALKADEKAVKIINT